MAALSKGVNDLLEISQIITCISVSFSEYLVLSSIFVTFLSMSLRASFLYHLTNCLA